MHREILDKNQLDLLPLIREFKRTFYLAGGTAVALHIGHRRSVDFDLFREGRINPTDILKKIQNHQYIPVVTRRVKEQLNLTVNNVKFTFFQYPFKIEKKVLFENIIYLPDLIDLAAMKAYALGRRAKWKDYVDLYYLLTEYFSIREISVKAAAIFGGLFSEKQFRAQLSFFDDVDYSEEVEFVRPPVSVQIVKDTLLNKAIEF